MTALQAHGVKFSMDDFGTGYSSLTYLRRLPFDQLKIDQAFVRGLPSEPMSVAIVESILAMSRGLGIEVVAEGIETPDELNALRERGCTMYQGYLFSRPIPTKDYESLLHKV
jgi:EAL domain-containing protein (putative c-di-GMP-specific phosphodiesterase class I)